MHSSILPVHLFSPEGLRLGAWFLGFSYTRTDGGRVERFRELQEEVSKRASRGEAAIFGCFWHHFHIFLPGLCMVFFLCCAYPNHDYEATQGARKQLKPWSIAFHVRKTGVTFGLLISLRGPRLLLGIGVRENRSVVCIERSLALECAWHANVANVCHACLVPLYFASACCMYGNYGGRGARHEGSAMGPTEIYARSKLAGEQVMQTTLPPVSLSACGSPPSKKRVAERPWHRTYSCSISRVAPP